MSTNPTAHDIGGVPVEFIPDTGINLDIGNASAVNEEKTVDQEHPVDERPWSERIAEARAQKEQQERNDSKVSETSEPVAEERKDDIQDQAQFVESAEADVDLTKVLDNTEVDTSLEKEIGIETNDDDNDDDGVKYPKDLNEDPSADVLVGNLVDDVPHLTGVFNPTGDPKVIAERLKKDPDDFYVKIMQLFSQVGTNVDMARDYLERIYNNGVRLRKTEGSIADSVVRNTTKPSEDGQRQKLSGKEAKLAVLARAKGLRKVHLLNSGFWVTLRPPRIAELSQWYNDVSMETKDFGRLLGGHVFMFSDVLLRKKFMEVLPTLIVDSNLENWRAPDRLAKMISFHDLDTLIWACCSLIYKEAITINVHCTNEECQYVAENYKVDVDKLRFNNLDAIPEEALGYLSKQLVSLDKVSSANIKQYHKLLGFNKDFVLGDVTYKLRIPSVYNFIECGTEFIKLIMESIKGIENGIDGELEREVRINIAKTYLPWVWRVVTPDFESDDPEAIAAQMEIDVTTDRSLSDRIMDYQYETKLTYFCYTMLECPKCHKTHSSVLKDYYPLDPTYLFFFLFSRQLSQMTSL